MRAPAVRPAALRALGSSFPRAQERDLGHPDFGDDCATRRGYIRQAAGWRIIREFPSSRSFICMESRFCNSAGKSENGTALAKSSSVHSGFSTSINSGFGLFILTSLLPAGPSQANNTESVSAHGKNQRIKCISNQSNRPDTNFTVIRARILGKQCRSQIKLRRYLKAKSPLPKIALALPWIERDLHTLSITRKHL